MIVTVRLAVTGTTAAGATLVELRTLNITRVICSESVPIVRLYKTMSDMVLRTDMTWDAGATLAAKPIMRNLRRPKRDFDKGRS